MFNSFWFYDNLPWLKLANTDKEIHKTFIMNFSKANMKSYFVVSIISMIFVSCSSNTYIKKMPIHQRYENEINYLGKDKHGKIILKDGQMIPALKMQVVGDSLNYLNKAQARYAIIHLNKVKVINFKDYSVGIVYGLVGGLGLATALGYLAIDWDAEMAGLGMLYYMTGGVLLGGISGGVLGIDRNYIFVEKEE